MNIEELLSQRINMPQIKSAVSWCSGNRERLGRLWLLANSGDRRTSVNALWVMTHLQDRDQEWILSLRDNMIDRLLVENDTGKKRMLLQLLRDQVYAADDIRTDLLDWCMSKINSECESCAVRCFSIYTAFKMCRHYPELLAELDERLDMLSMQSLGPGLKSALQQTKTNIRKLNEKCFRSDDKSPV